MSEIQHYIDIAKGILSILASLGTIGAGIFVFVRWVIKQDKQSEDIEANDKHIDTVEEKCEKHIVEVETECEKHIDEVEKECVEKIDTLKSETNEKLHSIQEEQALMCYGILAALKGLQEQGCNGPVTKAIDKFEKHLNVQAHK